MRFGTFSLPTYFPEVDGSVDEFYRRILGLLEESEAWGFDVVWANEHHFHPYGGMIPFPPVLLAAVAARTKRVRLGTSVALLPLHHPLQSAEAYAMLDEISGGRLELGVGRGFVEHDYQTFTVPWDEGQDRLLESVDVIVKAWEQQPFSHHGRFFHFDNVAVWPPPLQKPHPPIWGAATSAPQSFATYGTRGWDLLTVVHVNPLQELARLIQLYRDAARVAGHDPARLRVATHYQVYCSEDRADALRVGQEAVGRYREQNTAARTQGVATLVGPRGTTFDALRADDRVCIGRPDECVGILKRACQVLDVDEVHCTFYFGGIPYEEAHRSFELFAREVLPQLSWRSQPDQQTPAAAGSSVR